MFWRERVGQSDKGHPFQGGADGLPVQHAELLGLVKVQLKTHQEVL